jgi:hypothetical protein
LSKSIIRANAEVTAGRVGGITMSVWRFSIEGNQVKAGSRQRLQLSMNGCNEPYRDRYWCPKLQWFRREPCPFVNLQECNNNKKMCGAV